MLSTGIDYDTDDYLYEGEDEEEDDYLLSPLTGRGGAQGRMATPVEQMRRLQMTPRM